MGQPGVTLLTFESVVTLGFDEDQNAIQDAFTNAVTATYTVENVAETLQTPELEEKYGEFKVIGTDTIQSTLSPTTSPTRKPTGGKSKKAKKSGKKGIMKKGNVILKKGNGFLNNARKSWYKDWRKLL